LKYASTAARTGAKLSKTINTKGVRDRGRDVVGRVMLIRKK
jgi:hypothetical protein